MDGTMVDHPAPPYQDDFDLEFEIDGQDDANGNEVATQSFGTGQGAPAEDPQLDFDSDVSVVKSRPEFESELHVAPEGHSEVNLEKEDEIEAVTEVPVRDQEPMAASIAEQDESAQAPATHQQMPQLHTDELDSSSQNQDQSQPAGETDPAAPTHLDSTAAPSQPADESNANQSLDYVEGVKQYEITELQAPEDTVETEVTTTLQEESAVSIETVVQAEVAPSETEAYDNLPQQQGDKSQSDAQAQNAEQSHDAVQDDIVLDDVPHAEETEITVVSTQQGQDFSNQDETYEQNEQPTLRDANVEEFGERDCDGNEGEQEKASPVNMLQSTTFSSVGESGEAIHSEEAQVHQEYDQPSFDGDHPGDVPHGHDSDANVQSSAVGLGDSANKGGAGDQTAQDKLQETPQVLVQYKQDQFALFASSQSDDPEDYFLDLSQLSLLDKPLSNLIASLRHLMASWGDIPADHEVLVRVDELSIDFSETSTDRLVEQVSLQKLIDVHTALVHNEDAHAVKPMQLFIDTRPDCLKRLEALSVAARNGSGLSTVAQYYNSACTGPSPSPSGSDFVDADTQDVDMGNEGDNPAITEVNEEDQTSMPETVGNEPSGGQNTDETQQSETAQDDSLGVTSQPMEQAHGLSSVPAVNDAVVAPTVSEPPVPNDEMAMTPRGEGEVDKLLGSSEVHLEGDVSEVPPEGTSVDAQNSGNGFNTAFRDNAANQEDTFDCNIDDEEPPSPGQPSAGFEGSNPPHVQNGRDDEQHEMDGSLGDWDHDEEEVLDLTAGTEDAGTPPSNNDLGDLAGSGPVEDSGLGDSNAEQTASTTLDGSAKPDQFDANAVLLEAPTQTYPSESRDMPDITDSADGDIQWDDDLNGLDSGADRPSIPGVGEKRLREDEVIAEETLQEHDPKRRRA